MASPFVEKLQVAVITATVVSAGWIMAGAILLDREETAKIESELEEEAGQSEVETSPSDRASQSTDAAPASSDESAPTVPPEAELATLVIPVTGIARTDLVNSYGDERAGGERLHEGIDIMAEEGTPVVSVAPGTVERLFRSEAGGMTIYVRSEDRRTIYYYAHLSEYAEGLNEGQKVRRGQRLGSVGSTGNAEANAPHLHFEIMRTTANAEWWEPANSVNPYPLLTQQ